MCELFAMCSRRPATVSFSLKELALRGGRTGPHKDGWGIAYYRHRDAWLIKEAAAASDSRCVRFIEDYPIQSSLVISHIRKATQGQVSFENTQPHLRELGGRQHVFAHNGDLGEVRRHAVLRHGRFRPMGSSDSELAFCALLADLEPSWLDADSPPSVEERIRIVAEFAGRIRRLGPANFLYCDSELVFAHGHERRQVGQPGVHPPGLHLLCRTCSGEPSEVQAAGVMVAPQPGEQRVVLVASVPLTSEAWEPLGCGELAVISRGRVLARLGP